MERTLVILKPDAVQRSLIGQITARLEQRGIKLVGMRLIHIDGRALAVMARRSRTKASQMSFLENVYTTVNVFTDRVKITNKITGTASKI